ncbi:unnamed protein product, partial [Porites lobata]
MSNPILHLSRQNEATWASFHHRVSGIHYNYDQLFPKTVFQFLEAKAKSVGSSIGYLVPSLMTATSFLLGNTDAHFLNGNHIQPLNLYTMSVGHPGTGKSPAIETKLNQTPRSPFLDQPRSKMQRFLFLEWTKGPRSSRSLLNYCSKRAKADTGTRRRRSTLSSRPSPKRFRATLRSNLRR